MSLKAKFLTLKNSVIGEINMITEKLNTLLLFAKNRLNISKRLILKILSENQSAFKECSPQQSNPCEAIDDSNVPVIDSKKTVNRNKKRYTA